MESPTCEIHSTKALPLLDSALFRRVVQVMASVAFVVCTATFYVITVLCLKHFEPTYGWFPQHLSDMGAIYFDTNTFFNFAMALCGYAVLFAAFELSPAFLLKASSLPTPSARRCCQFIGYALPVMGLGPIGCSIWTSWDALFLHLFSLGVTFAVFFVIVVLCLFIAPTKRTRAVFGLFLVITAIYVCWKPDYTFH
jgi:hypothetical membrane protein